MLFQGILIKGIMKKYLIEDFVGKTFNRVTVTGEVRLEGREREFTYNCVCGGSGKCKPSHLIKGNVKSCGCLHKETSADNGRKVLSTHSMSGTRPHRIWRGMKSRCDNSAVKEYPDYGGRGITYCDKWKTFEGFWEDMEEGYSDNLTIDRTDTNGNYTKENCEWEDMSVQCHHRRKRKGSSCEYLGVTQRPSGKFEAGFCKHGKKVYLGIYDTAIEAATAYDNAYEEVYGVRNNKT